MAEQDRESQQAQPSDQAGHGNASERPPSTEDQIVSTVVETEHDKVDAAHNIHQG